MFHVRPVETRDFHYILDIDLKCFDDPWSLPDWRDETLHILVSTVDDAPVGFVVMRMVIEGDMAGAGILKIGVKQQYRRSGIGNALVEAASMRAKGEGIPELWLRVPEDHCDPSTDNILEWLQKVGFVGVAVQDDMYVFRRTND